MSMFNLVSAIKKWMNFDILNLFSNPQLSSQTWRGMPAMQTCRI